MGAGPRPVIEDALRKLGVETRLSAGVASLDESGVTLSSGEHIETETVIWAAGMRAAPLTAQIPAERDNFGRLLVDRALRVRRRSTRSTPSGSIRRRPSAPRRSRRQIRSVSPISERPTSIHRVFHAGSATYPDRTKELSK
jgi:hypothetical protein